MVLVVVRYCIKCSMASLQYAFSHMLLTLLILFWNITLGSAVCIKCHGMAVAWGCTGDKDTCPFTTGMVANVASMAAAAVGTVAVVKLLPGYINAWFGHDTLTMISGLAKKVSPGTFSFADKMPHQITMAVKVGNTTRGEAVSHIHSVLETIMGEFDTAEGDALKRLEMKQKSWQGALSAIQSMSVSVGSSSEDESLTSAPLYILAVICGRLCKKGKGNEFTLDVCEEIDETREVSKKGLKARLVRPTTVEQFYGVLNLWVMVCEATCVAPCLVTTAFLDQVAFKPMRESEFQWQIAFEVIVRYLVIVENSNKHFELGNVFMKAGAWDSVKTLALNEARVQHPKASFRTPGGNPGTSTGDEDPKKPPASDTKVANISGFTATSKVGCAAYNTGGAHLAKHIHWSTKICKYNHACDRLLEDRDERGRNLHCLGNHKRDACDNPKRKQ